MALAFFSMLGSGLLINKSGGSYHGLAYVWHLSSAAVLILGVAVVVWRGDRRGVVRTGRELRDVDADDRAWLASVPAAVLKHAPQPPAGRFNGGQKVNFLLLSGLLVALFVSGLGLVITGLPHSPIFSVAHVAAAILAVILVVGHMYMALINPSTRPSLSGMFSGTVERSWMRKHHSRAPGPDAARGSRRPPR